MNKKKINELLDSLEKWPGFEQLQISNDALKSYVQDLRNTDEVDSFQEIMIRVRFFYSILNASSKFIHDPFKDMDDELLRLLTETTDELQCLLNETTGADDDKSEE
jgi:hypothetical protein